MSTDEKIQAYTHERLSLEERAAFEGEMEINPALRAEVSAMSAVKSAFAQDHDDMPEHGWARFSDRIEARDPRAANDNRPFRFSMFQAACLAVAAVLGWQVIATTVLQNEPTSYTTASSQAAGPTVQVVFNATAVLSDVSEILAELDGRIIDGPSAVGLYVVAFPDAALQGAAFEALQERSDIVSEVFKN